MLGRIIEKWAVGRQEQELSEFVTRLRSMNADEIGFLVCMATHMRHNIERQFGILLLLPVVTNIQKPDITVSLGELIREYQSQGRHPLAAAVMVWLHSLRAMSALASPRLRDLGRDMWNELERGFDHVPGAMVTAVQMAGEFLNIEGAARRPDGLERMGSR